jgi:hypothetical protein
MFYQYKGKNAWHTMTLGIKASISPRLILAAELGVRATLTNNETNNQKIPWIPLRLEI